MTKTSCKIVCPFCSLLCDDVTVSLDNNRFEVKNKNLSLCKKKIEFFNLDKNNRLTPTINNKTSSLRETISTTEKILKKSGDITIINHGVDMAGVRSMLRLASRYDCTIDHVNSKYLYNNIGLVQRTGYMATSLTEVKNRADVIMIFGNDIFKKSPRLVERISSGKSSLGFFKGKRKIILVGNFDANATKVARKIGSVVNLKTDIDMIPKILSQLMQRNDNSTFKLSKSLREIHNIINKSTYLVASWSASDFNKSLNSERIINSISDFIVERNINYRAACFPIAGNLGDSTSSQVCTWMTGFPSRIKSYGNTFKHDRYLCDSELIQNNKTTDTVIHFSTLSDQKIQLNKSLKNIVLGHPKSKLSCIPDVFIPVGVPGIDYEGIMFRTDNVVSLPLKKIRDVALPTIDDIVREIT